MVKQFALTPKQYHQLMAIIKVNIEQLSDNRQLFHVDSQIREHYTKEIADIEEIAHQLKKQSGL